MRAYTRLLLAATACLVLVGAQDSNYVYPAPFVAWEQLSVANGTTISAPITGNGWVVAANSDGSLVGRQIDDFNGSSVWNYTASSSPYNVIFNLPNGQGFAAYYDTYVIAMTFDGNPLWQWNTTDNNATVGPYYELLMYTPVFDGDVVFIGTSSTSDLESPSYVYALNTSSGNVTWASFAGGDCNTQMDKDEKKLYVSSYQNGDMLQAFDLKTGELVWNVTIPHMAFTLKVANEKVFVGSYTGAVWVYDAATGKSKGSLPVQGDAVLVPMTVIGETLIVFSGGHANGINVNTQKVAFFANQISATENVKGYMVDGETIFVAYYGVVYKMNAKNGKGGKFYSSDFIFDDFGGFTYLRNKTILAFTMSALVFLDAKTGKLILAETNTNPVGTPLLLPPNAAGEEIIAVGNQLAAPGWPMECMKLFYVPMLTVQAADGTSFPGSYWGTVTVFTPMNPIYEAGTLYSFDTNYMYSFDPTTGVMNWEWTNPNLVMVTFPPMLYTSGILVATTGYTDIFVNASQGVQANYNSSNFGSYGGKYLAASNSGLVYIVGSYSSAILTVDVNTFTVVSQYNDSSLTCKTAPTPLNIVGGGNWVAAQCKGRLAMLDAAHGLTVWNITLPSTYEFTSHPFFSADETTLYIGFFTGPASGTLYAMNTSTGVILWKLDTIDPVYTGNVSCTVDAKTGAESCDTLIVASPNAMYSINAHTGAVQWKATHLVNMTGTMLLSPVHIVGETVVVRNDVLMWGVNLKTGEIMWVVTPDNADYSFGENGASTNGRYFFTPMAAYVLGYDVMNGNLVLKVYTQGTPNGVVITENCVMIFAQTPSDVGDNEVMGLTLPSSLCTPLGSM